MNLKPPHSSNAAHRRSITGMLLTSLVGVSLLVSGCGTGSQGIPTRGNRAVQDYFALIDSVKKEQPDLVEALTKFPKGADLHNHLSGAVMPEDFINLGKEEGDCFGPDPLVPAMYTTLPATAPGVCSSGFKPLAQASSEEQQQLIRSFSMFRFNDNGVTSIQAGHDHFFNTFARFATIDSARNTGRMLAKLLQQEKAENVAYVETMVSPQADAINRLADLLRQRYPDAATYAQTANYPAMYAYLLSAGLNDVVAAAQNDIANFVSGVNAVLNCGTAYSDPACEVLVNFQASVYRNSELTDGSADLPNIFTQTAVYCLLADTERRVVGVNLLGSEDAPVSMTSFHTQMKFFGYFHNRFPRVNIVLHAGEITPYFVGSGNPALKDHLTGSIQAGAKRLGHAVSFSYLNDDDKIEVASLMKRSSTAVEINFTSNAQILGVAGDEHPFPDFFRKYGIPAVMATDDEGVSYANFTDEWIYAARQYRITYTEAVQLARSSLQYSFLAGAPLWQDVASSTVVSQCAGETLGGVNPGEPCRTYLGGSEKAGAQWSYEKNLSGYDKAYGATLREYLGN
jgi:adenosine deaminase